MDDFKCLYSTFIDISNVTYYWELIEGAKVGSTETTYTEPVLSLTNLKPGTAKWRATVREKEKSAFKDITITILPFKKPNRPPKVHINPSSPVFAIEGNQVVLDGQGSIDEDGNQLEFEWKLLHGPAFELSASKSPVLRLDNLNRGNYTFDYNVQLFVIGRIAHLFEYYKGYLHYRLAVKDSQGEKASGTVDVIVSAKRDDPPKAQITDCNDQTIRTTMDIRLPLKTLTLCANTSTDDYVRYIY
uniref:REJ domain-containing protein n=1 Tax=Syphacia muris TaxID=451379 RepID=A0A0N5ANG3_9BILA